MEEMKYETQILGRLFAGGREYDMLSLKPAERVSLATYGALQFYVRNTFGYAVYIVVKGDFVIEPYPDTVSKEVTYILDEEVKPTTVDLFSSEDVSILNK